MATQTAVPPEVAPRPLRDLLTTVVTGGAAGMVSGFLVGGIGGRLAMRLLAATSPAEAQGRLTDDGAVVGVVSLGGTASLLLLTTALGAATGFGYLLARRVLPPRRTARVAVFAAFTGSVGGALLVHDSASFDFGRLQPQWLAVVLFVALPTLGGASIAALTERGLARARRTSPPAWWLLLLGVAGAVLMMPILASSPFVLAGAVLAVALAVAVVTVPALAALWRSRAVTAAGTAVLVALVVWGLYGLAADVVSIVTGVRSDAPLTV